MKINDNVLSPIEKAVFCLRSLYRTYGYSQYKMSKFEEYDLYARNGRKSRYHLPSKQVPALRQGIQGSIEGRKR